jgi:hypothetical protein
VLIYFGFFLLLGLVDLLTLLIKKPKTQTLVLVLTSYFLVALFVGLRSIGNSPDGQQYFDFYSRFGALSWKEVFTQKVESGYVFFNKLLYSLRIPYLGFQLAYSFLIWGLFVYFLYTFSSHFRISFFCFVVFGLYFTMTAFRQAMAAAFVSLAICFLKTGKNNIKKIIFFYIFAAIAFTFHKTSVFSFALPLLYFLIANRRIPVVGFLATYILFAVCCRSFYSFAVSFIHTPYSPESRNSIPQMSLFYAAIFVLGDFFLYPSALVEKVNGLFLRTPERFCYIDGIPSKEEKTSKDLNPEPSIKLNKNGSLALYFYRGQALSSQFINFFLVFVGVAGIAMVFSLVNVVFARLYYYGIGAASLIIGEAIIRQKSSRLSLLASLAVFILMGLYFYVAIKNSGYWSVVVPYHLYS